MSVGLNLAGNVYGTGRERTRGLQFAFLKGEGKFCGRESFRITKNQLFENYPINAGLGKDWHL